jgi:hypothetical protein
MEKVIKDGKVAVIYSPGYGSGWFSWNSRFPEILFHPKLVELVLENRHNEITREFVKDLLGIDSETYFFMGSSANQLEVIWLDEGTKFYVRVYDGSEDIITSEDIKWQVA